MVFPWFLFFTLLCLQGEKFTSYRAPKITESPLPNGSLSCFIGQLSKDGFGHQVEGKITCLGAGLLLPEYEYFHFRFFNGEHGFDPDLLEEYLNLPSLPLIKWQGSISYNDSKWPPPFENPQSIILQEDPEIQIVRHKEKSSCIPKKNEIYWVDNCWEIFYGKVVKRRRFFSNWYQRIQPDLLFSFLSSPRSVHHNFKKDSVNIVVHVRRNDAGRNRRIPEEIFLMLIQSFRDIWADLSAAYPTNSSIPHSKKLVGKKLHFYIHSDSKLKNMAAPDITTYFSRSNLTQAVSQMIQSDIFIGSFSSLSYLSGLYSKHPCIFLLSSTVRFMPHYIYVSENLKDYPKNRSPRSEQIEKFRRTARRSLALYADSSLMQKYIQSTLRWNHSFFPIPSNLVTYMDSFWKPLKL